MRLIRLAEQKAKQLSEMLQASLKKHDVERVQARIRRHNQTLSAPQLQGRAVTVLNSSDVIGRTDQHIIHTHYCSRMPEARTQIVRHVLRPVVTSASIYSCCQLSSCCTALMHVKLEMRVRIQSYRQSCLHLRGFQVTDKVSASSELIGAKHTSARAAKLHQGCVLLTDVHRSLVAGVRRTASVIASNCHLSQLLLVLLMARIGGSYSGLYVFDPRGRTRVRWVNVWVKVAYQLAICYRGRGSSASAGFWHR